MAGPHSGSQADCSVVAEVRAALDAHGHHNVKIVAPDAFKTPLKPDLEMLAASPDAKYVDVWGLHGAAPLTEVYGDLEPFLTSGKGPLSRPLFNSENEVSRWSPFPPCCSGVSPLRCKPRPIVSLMDCTSARSYSCVHGCRMSMKG